ncbi:MAG: hypothetical protein GX053_13855, partial [Tissierella sp.]|nr:hypothetical protein [Tissierella sp.]
MTNSKRMLSLILALTMVLSMGVSAFGNALVQLTDIDNHWAKEEINFMTTKGVINGYDDGTFKPDNNMTKVEFYKVINHLMGYEEKADEVKFKDVKESNWFYDEVAKALAKGYIKDGERLNPNELITREEVVRIIGVAFELEKDAKAISDFTDSAMIILAARGYVGTLKAKGYINGYPDGTFGAKNNITRAEVVKMLFNVFDAEGIPEVVEPVKEKPKKSTSSPAPSGGGGGGGGTSRPTKILVTSIGLEDNVTSVVYGNELQLTANITPSNATNKSVTWSTDNNKASIDQNGLLRTNEVGAVKVTATAKDGSNVSNSLSINIVAELLKGSSGVSVEADDSGVIEPGTVLKSEAVTDEAEVDNITQVIARTGAVSGKQLVSLFSIKLEKDSTTVQPNNGNVRVKIKITPEMGQYDDFEVVHIDANGNVDPKPTTVEGGYIVFETNHFSNYAVVGKEKAPMLAIEVEFTDSLIYLKAGDQFNNPNNTKLNPADATLTYVSSNPEVVTIDRTTGKMKGISVGDATITVTARKEEFKTTTTTFNVRVREEVIGDVEIKSVTAENGMVTVIMSKSGAISSQRFTITQAVKENGVIGEAFEVKILNLSGRNERFELEVAKLGEKFIGKSIVTYVSIDNKEAVAAEAFVVVSEIEEPELNKEELDKAILEANGKVKAEYTEESWSALEEALRLPESTQDEIDDKVEAINVAIESLEKVEEPGEDPTVENVSTLEEFKIALEDVTKSIINITEGFETNEKILVSRPVEINGGNNT